MVPSYPTYFILPVSQKIGFSAQNPVQQDKVDKTDYISEKRLEISCMQK